MELNYKIQEGINLIMINKLFIISILLISSLCAESSGVMRAHLKFVALGHQRLATFIKSDKDTYVDVVGESGKIEKYKIPAGSPHEVVGTKYEYMPRNLFVQYKGIDSKVQYKPLVLSLNRALQITIDTTSSDIALVEEITEMVDGKQQSKYKEYLPLKISASGNSLFLLVANYSEKEFWKKPKAFIYDASVNNIPKGNVYFFNATPFSMELQMPNSDDKPISVAPYKSVTLQVRVNELGKSLLVAFLISPKDGSKRQFYHNTFDVPQDGRAYMCAYYDPKPRTPNPAGVMKFVDTLPVIEE